MNNAYEYCKKSIELETTPKYVKLQMQDFINYISLMEWNLFK